MDNENYEVDLKTWASSLMELEVYSFDTDLRQPARVNSDIVALSATYYRSKAFSSFISINNLINAADPLLTLASKLRVSSLPGDIVTLQQNICHEIRAFENKAQTFDYRPQLIFAARFVICALLDELLTIILWPDLEWQKYSLIDYFHKDSSETDRFFIILERALQDPEANLDLLELMYICLRLGYEGKYRQQERGFIELRDLTDDLYNIITNYKEDSSRSLHITSTPVHRIKTTKKTYLHLLPPSWLVGAVMASSLLIMFSCYSLRLHEATKPIRDYIHAIQFDSVNISTPLVGT